MLGKICRSASRSVAAGPFQALRPLHQNASLARFRSPIPKSTTGLTGKDENTSGSSRPFNPRRALLYVPGSDDKKIRKVSQLKVDCVCLDLEDGVGPARETKAAARLNIKQILNGEKELWTAAKSAGGAKGPEITVRVNSLSSGLCHEDVEAIFTGLDPAKAPSAVHLPKVNDPEDLATFGKLFEGSFLHKDVHKVGLIFFVESARALVQLTEICLAAVVLAEKSCLVPECIVFGSDDFLADIGGHRTKEATELMYARQKVVTVAKAFGLQVIDMVYIDYKDDVGLRAQAEAGARMGFTGKQIIHPSQIDIVQEAFKPSADKIEWATQLIREFHEHTSKGRGAFSFRGVMIDAPLVKQAQNIVQLAEKISA